MRLTVREMIDDDAYYGFAECLERLSEVGLSPDKVVAIKKRREKNPFLFTFVAVGDDEGEDYLRVVGTASLVVEQKFIHQGGRAAHIEDVASLRDGKGVGRALMEHLVAFARQKGCYKVTLHCDEDVVGFYEKLGFRRCGNAMRVDL